MIAVLSVPTLITHWAVGHVDWAVAAAFAAGLIPSSFAGGRLASRFTKGTQRRAFGCFLVSFGSLFTIYRLLSR